MNFKEYMIKEETGIKERLIIVFSYIIAVIIGVAAFPFLAGFGGLALLLLVGLVYFAYHFTARFKREYEYICTEETVDIDVILNKSKRKRLLSFNISQTEIVASVKDSNYSFMLNQTFDKKIDATSKRKNVQVYFAIVEKEGRTLLKFEPPREMLEILQKYSRSKIHISEE